jgi:hypothetical protein
MGRASHRRASHGRVPGSTLTPENGLLVERPLNFIQPFVHLLEKFPMVLEKFLIASQSIGDGLIQNPKFCLVKKICTGTLVQFLSSLFAFAKVNFGAREVYEGFVTGFCNADGNSVPRFTLGS